MIHGQLSYTRFSTTLTDVTIGFDVASATGQGFVQPLNPEYQAPLPAVARLQTDENRPCRY
jgi:hypothetical protein